MRPLELALVLALTIDLAVALASTSRAVRRPALGAAWSRGTAAWAVLLLGATIAQLALEGPRWNLAPLYVVVAARGLSRALGRLREGRPRRRSARIGTVLVWAAVSALAVVLPVLLPVPRLPPPTGAYPVGTDAFEYIVDGLDGEGDPFRARARVWYPAAEGSAARGPWLEHLGAMLPALAVRAGLPPWTMGHLRHVQTNAAWGIASAGDGLLGVVTFDHGRGGFAAQNSFLAEELASHGWLVVAPEHPGGAVLTVFSDGTEVPFDPVLFGDGRTGQTYDDAIGSLGRRWARETQAALDALGAGGGPATLAGRVDRSRLVASGHSTGGGTAFGLCEIEPGCIAAVGLDPWLLPTPPELLADPPVGGLRAPLAGLFSDPELGFFEPLNLATFDRLADLTRAAGFEATTTVYPGAGHMDFADVGLLSPIADRLGLYVGPASPGEVLPTIRAQVLNVLGSAEAAASRTSRSSSPDP